MGFFHRRRRGIEIKPLADVSRADVRTGYVILLKENGGGMTPVPVTHCDRRGFHYSLPNINNRPEAEGGLRIDGAVEYASAGGRSNGVLVKAGMRRVGRLLSDPDAVRRIREQLS